MSLLLYNLIFNNFKKILFASKQIINPTRQIEKANIYLLLKLIIKNIDRKIKKINQNL